MRARIPYWIAAASIVAVIVGGCSSAANVAGESPPPDESLSELEALYRARQDSARMRFTDADVHFMTGMIAHHAQALVMAALTPTHGASAEIQRLAARIDNAQKDEIATMQRWLRSRDQPVPEIEIDGTNLMIHGAGGHSMHHIHMPGMLTPEQLHELDEANGAEFDRLFLTYMIQHHSGAVTMVHDLFSTDGAGQDEDAFRLASDIQVDQITEIERMELMLEALPRAGPDP